MKPIKFVLICLFSVCCFAQEVSLEDIFVGKFQPKYIQEIKSLNDGKHYVVLEQNGIIKYHYENQNSSEVLLSGSFDDYFFSNDENQLVVSENSEQIYRHSKRAVYTLHDLKTKKSQVIFNGKKIQEPHFSPDNSKIAFVFENNIYYQKLSTNQIVQITYDGKAKEIINGICDWVYEEEFGFVRHFEWTKDGNNLVFVRFDESKVPQVTIPMYEGNLYPKELEFKYPKAGENNSEVSLISYQVSSGKSTKISLHSIENYYLINLKQTSRANEILLISSNRKQNKADVSILNTSTHQIQKLFSQIDDAWIDTDNFTVIFTPTNDFFLISDQDGFQHIYLYETHEKSLKQLTKGTDEVTKIYGFDEKYQKIYFQATANKGINRTVNVLELKSNIHKKIIELEGFNEANFSSDFTYFINTNSTYNSPPVYALYSNEGKLIKTLEDNRELKEKTVKSSCSVVGFSEFTLKNGTKLNYWEIKPKEFNSSKKYPVLMYVYGGPGSQQVKNEWNPFYYWWFQHLAGLGYYVICVDNRGTGGKGRAFKKITYKQLGKFEVEDQVEVANLIKQYDFVNDQRIGIFGWSFGGYLSSLAITKFPDVFKSSIAVAPVTNWRFYDTIYTERFLITPQENPLGYDDNSPIHYAKNLKGNYLLIHGTADDNVHFQNATELSRILVSNAIDFDYFPYTDKNHGIYGGKTRYHLFKKITKFIKEKL